MEKMNSGELNVDRLALPHRLIRRIGLLSPTSANLGNAAMQSAMIANLRKRIPGVEILGITLNPDDTRRRHGIEAFPLAVVSRPHYGPYNSDSSQTRQRQAPKLRRIKQWLKQIPVLPSFLRAIRICGMELTHLAAAARVVRKLDRVIIPGGGALDDFWGGPWGHPWALFKWSVLSRVFGVPFLFVSIGKSSLERPLSRFFVRIALRLAAYRSYRDHNSKIAVQTLIDARNDPVCPDLAFSYPCSTIQITPNNGSRDGRLVVGVSPIAYCDPRGWPLKDERRYAAYVSQLAEMVRWLIRERHRVLFFTTDDPDAATVGDVRTMISGSAIDADAIQTLRGSAEQSPGSLLKGISRADLIIASRLHGVILSYLNSTPVLALSFDPKVDAHMDILGQTDYCLSIDHLQLDTLIERFAALRAARQREQAHLRSATLRFRDLLDVQYDRIAGVSRFSSVTSDYRDQIGPSPLSEIGGFRPR
jgi:polysaccharide pyruvyl transferase WcaK-like protein